MSDVAKEKGMVILADKNKVEIRIAGKDYRLVGIESDEYIQKIGLYIDKKMNEILRQNNSLSTSMAAVLTAVNVADDLMKMRERDDINRKEIKSLQEKLKALEEENSRIVHEREDIGKKCTDFQLELAKREAELKEVRSTIEKSVKPRAF